jgi:hypothetical protein
LTIGDPGYIEYDTETRKKSISQKYTIEGKDLILEDMALGLLRCKKLVSSEVAVISYKLNTFHFGGNRGLESALYPFKGHRRL